MNPTLWIAGDVLRGQLSASDAASLIIRIAVWIKLTLTQQLPPHLTTTRPADARISGRELAQYFSRLVQEAPRPAALVFEPVHDRHYDALSEHQVSALLERIHMAMQSGGPQRADFDDILTRASTADRGALFGPAVDVGAVLVALTGASENEAVPCLGRGSEFIAIAAMSMGRSAILRTEANPFWAAAFAVLFDRSLDAMVVDPLEMALGLTDQRLPYKVAVAAPPFNLKYDAISRPRWMHSRYGARFAHSLYIEMLMNIVSERIVTLVPNSFLFARGSEAIMREQFIRSGQLASVVAFPAGLLFGTSIPFSAVIVEPNRSHRSTTMFKVNEAEHVAKEGKERVRARKLLDGVKLVDAIKNPASPSACTVSLEEIANQEFVLTPERYLAASGHRDVALPQNTPTVRLGDVVLTIRSQAWPEAKSSRDIRIREIGVAELPEYGFIGMPMRERTVDADAFSRRQKQVLMSGDVLISIKGSVGKTGIVGQQAEGSSEEYPRVASQSFLVLRLKHGSQILDPMVLLMILRSPPLQSAITAVTSASTVPVIQARDIENLSIPIFSADEQLRLIDLFHQQLSIQEEIARLRHQQRDVANEVWMSISG